jgi:hypothetical protein
MKALIVSTYPMSSTGNIGDRLIEDSTIKLIRDILPNCEVELVFRGAHEPEFREKYDACDIVVFACFAIRAGLRKVYPSLHVVLDGVKPVICLAAGAKFDMVSAVPFSKQISQEDKELLRFICKKSKLFTTRGPLTQQLCEKIGAYSAIYTGDVTFYDPTIPDRSNAKTTHIQNIIVSDPHYAEVYLNLFANLLDGLSGFFPHARIYVVQHGKNIEAIQHRAEGAGAEYIPAYQDGELGTNCYDKCDLHVGFRLHGHVSALRRGKPSFLFEQDSRGCEYGLALPGKISVPAFGSLKPFSKVYRALGSRIDLLNEKHRNQVDRNNLTLAQILTLVERAYYSDFADFFPVYREIQEISDRFQQLTRHALEE